MIPGAELLLAVVLSGQVRAPDAEVIYAPMSESSPVTLRYAVPDGTAVEPGDSLVRVDPGAALAQQESLKAQIAAANAEQKRIQKQVAFEQDQQRKNASTIAEAQRKGAMTRADIAAMDLKTQADILNQ